jgi:putative flippase GtrA
MIPVQQRTIFRRVMGAWRERSLALKALSFGLIGVVNSAVDFGVFALAYYYFGTSIIVAQIAAWLLAVTGSYVMNSMITFAAESGKKLGVKSYASFALAQIAGFFANTATVYLVSYGLERLAGLDVNRAVLVGKLLAIGASFAVNFSLSHFVVFRRR